MGMDAFSAGDAAEVILRADKLTKHFPINKKQVVHALNEADLSLVEGETLALVGESGCGKSTLARTLTGLIPPTSGKVWYRGQELTGMSKSEFRRVNRKMQMVFQDPYASLDPRMTVRDLIAEPLETYHVCAGKEETTEKVLELMERVGLPGEFLMRYPHQFSGGQRQRIGIARAIALDPEILICDEPVSALDVSVQAQILNLLKDLQKELGLTYLFISHNLAVVDYMADRIAVMCAGRIVEIAPREIILRDPVHPYTKALLAAVPFPDLDRPLDFKTLKASGASDERAWGPKFSSGDSDDPLSPADLGNGHVVLARRNVDTRELRSW